MQNEDEEDLVLIKTVSREKNSSGRNRQQMPDKHNMEDISWKLIDTYFKSNPNNLVAHHLDSYNTFFGSGINNIFKENNPIRFIERKDKNETDEFRNECLLYLGGKDGNKLYFGKPIIYDENQTHYMYPNDARLRNMTYGMTVHYDVDVEMTYYVMEGDNSVKKEFKKTYEKIYLGKFPIMLQSNLCILKSLEPDVRFNMGECRNDYGGYFIIDGKEKVIVSQEKFANNMIYVKANNDDDIYSHFAEIRSVSEDASKAIRKTAVKIIAPSPRYSNNQIVVTIPNVRKHIPLFIVMRALGVISDKQIIETCLLDMEKYESYVDLFIPSIHDCNKIFNQQTALEFIASFTKRETIDGVLEILMNYFLPHIGEMNFLDKAHFLGYMVFRMLRVFKKEEKPTDRDNFRFKRIELSGFLIYDLFREYYLIQKRAISLAIDSEHYYHTGNYLDSNFVNLIENNFNDFFKERVIENGFRKAFKGNWGSEEHTKRVGVVQDLNRLSWNTFISHLRKINLPLDASAKVVGPRHLNSSQWGYIDPVDTPDGGNIGLHKHMSISTIITSGFSSYPLIKWLRSNTPMKILSECTHFYMAKCSKVFVNGNWIGVLQGPLEMVKLLKLFRRNGILPVQTSISFDYKKEEIYLYTDAGRLSRPIYYIENGIPSFLRKDVIDMFNKGTLTWNQILCGLKEKADDRFSVKRNKLYELSDLYPSIKSTKELDNELEKNSSIVDLIDTTEEESALIAMTESDVKKNKYYTNLEIDPSLILGVMGNSIIFPEHNQFPRDVFSCGQSKQAVSVYHSNYHMRIDKMGVVLNYGQVPLIKSRYLDYINKEQMPYGVNAIVAIMSYTGYNVEDAILINEGAISRGIFRTTYFSMYESREESAKISGKMTNSVFTDVAHSTKEISGTKAGYDYNYLDAYGMIKEETPLHDKIAVIGRLTSSINDPNVATDSSVFPKKGQMGFVDKAFITEGEEGTKIAKVRIREERIPAIGDKMASRAGQKGTLGLIIPEEDMPFTSDGVRPDLIINPHALPSRMTIGQLVESLYGKLCTEYGGYGDCTAFATKGSQVDLYGKILTKAGFHSSGNQLLYNGMTGEQLQADIFMGPTYYMRLKHMVKDKINYRARGARTGLTRQTVQGRANDGGLRVGEMERDGILSHGMSHFLNESFMVRGDEYYMAVCNKTGGIAVYNKPRNLFLSPFADGPLKFYETLDGKQNLDNISRFGRSFSIVRIPYTLKLLIQELQTMNIQMRIITEDNIDHLMSMSYSNSAEKMIQRDPLVREIPKGDKTENQYLQVLIAEINMQLNRQRDNSQADARKTALKPIDKPSTPSPPSEVESPEYATGSPAYQPSQVESPEYATGSPAFQPPLSEVYSPPYDPGKEYSPQYNPLASDSPPNFLPGQLDPNSPLYQPNTPPYSSNLEQPQRTTPVLYSPHSPTDSPPSDLPEWQRIPPPNQSQSVVQISGPVQVNPLSSGVQISGPVQIQTLPSNIIDFGNPELNRFYESLPQNIKRQISGLPIRDQRMVLLKVKQKQEEKELEELLQKQTVAPTQRPTAILQIDETSEEEGKEEKDEEDETKENPSGGSIKKVRF